MGRTSIDGEPKITNGQLQVYTGWGEGGAIAVPKASKNGGEIAVKLWYISFWSPDSMPAMSSGGAQDFVQKGFFDQLCTQLVG